MEFELEKRPMKEFDSRFVGRFWVDKVTVINVEVLESSAALALREASIIEPIRKDNFGTVNWWAAGMIGE